MIKKLIKPIFLGMIAAGGALVFELLFLNFFPENNFSETAFSPDIIIFLIIAAGAEEFFKLLVIYKGMFSQKNNREFLYSSLLLGLGFALSEIAFSGYFSISGDPNLYPGILGIIFIHSFSAGLIGYLLLKTRARTFSALIIILFAATLLHFAYNAAVVAGYLQK